MSIQFFSANGLEANKKQNFLPFKSHHFALVLWPLKKFLGQAIQRTTKSHFQNNDSYWLYLRFFFSYPKLELAKIMKSSCGFQTLVIFGHLFASLWETKSFNFGISVNTLILGSYSYFAKYS